MTNDIEERRKRVYTWYCRFAFPKYDAFKKSIRTSSGLNITEDDVDLLPWNEAKRLDKKEWEAMQAGTSTRDYRKPGHGSSGDGNCIEKSDGGSTPPESSDDEEESASAEDSNNEDDGSSEYSEVTVSDNESATSNDKKKTLKPITAQSQYGPLARAHLWYNRLARPKRATMHRTVDETLGMDITHEDVDLLPWDPTNSYILIDNLDHLIKVEQTGGCVKSALDELMGTTHSADNKSLGSSQHSIGSRRGVGRSYSCTSQYSGSTGSRRGVGRSLSGCSLHSMMSKEKLRSQGRSIYSDSSEDSSDSGFANDDHEMTEDQRKQHAYMWYKTLAKPTCATFHKVIEETTGLDVTKEDVDLLPWTEDKTKVIEEEMMSPEEKAALERLKKMEQDAAEKAKHEAEEAERKRQQEEKDRKQKAAEEARRRGEELARLEMEEKRKEEEEEERQQAEELERNKKFEGLKQKEEKRNKAADERKRKEDEARRLREKEEAERVKKEAERQRQELEDRIRRDKEEAEEAERKLKRLEEEELRSRRREKDEEELEILKFQHKKEQKEEDSKVAAEVAEMKTMRRKLEREERKQACEERIAREKEEKEDAERRKREAEKEVAWNAANTEEARILRAYAWWSRMARPKKKDFKERIGKVAHADITPDDVDLLPWNFNGSMVNVAKMNKYINAQAGY